MAHRVIQWSTGNVGFYSLRAIIGHPELELAGVWVHGEKKSGRDAGELCGLSPVGVVATRDADALLEGEADCVVYTATADLRPAEAIDDLCGILAAGKNVVSSSMVGLVHPKTLNPDWTQRLEAACGEGGTSFLTSGIDPGFANDTLPLVLSGLCERWEEIRIQEIVNYATYDQPEVVLGTMGFGKPLDHTPLLLTPGALSFAWGGTIRLLAEGLGVELDEIRQVHERRPADRDLETPMGIIENDHPGRAEHRAEPRHGRRARRPRGGRCRPHRHASRERHPLRVRCGAGPAVGARPAAHHGQGAAALNGLRRTQVSTAGSFPRTRNR
jgi:4-hydroxy-tetrahydrodipicolinate reductase